METEDGLTAVVLAVNPRKYTKSTICCGDF